MNLKPLSLVVGIALIAGTLWFAYTGDGGDVTPVGNVAAAYLVRESSTQPTLPAAVLLWMSDPKLRADAKAKGIAFFIVDPDQVDRDGKTPAVLVPIIAAAVKAGLPRFVTATANGALKDYPLPQSDAEVRKLLGI